MLRLFCSVSGDSHTAVDNRSSDARKCSVSISSVCKVQNGYLVSFDYCNGNVSVTCSKLAMVRTPFRFDMEHSTLI
jgi:hypothetical protein